MMCLKFKNDITWVLNDENFFERLISLFHSSFLILWKKFFSKLSEEEPI